MTYPPFVQAIFESLRPELRVCPIELQESNPEGRHPPIRLGKSDEALCVSFDQACTQFNRGPLADWLHPLLCPRRHLRKSCDFVVFHQHRAELFVLFFELKSADSGQAREQIACTRLFIDYLLDLVVRVRRIERIPIHYRGIVFNERARAKKWSPHTVPYCYDRDPRMRDLGCTTAPRRDFFYLEAFCGHPPKTASDLVT
jgi:hypothetical protein